MPSNQSKRVSVVSSVPVVAALAIDPQQILTIDELATRLKTSRRWVYEKSRRRCNNPLPVIRIGRYLRFNWIDVSTWLQRQSTGGAA
jgi:excisionase family DNA binding protein